MKTGNNTKIGVFIEAGELSKPAAARASSPLQKAPESQVHLIIILLPKVLCLH